VTKQCFDSFSDCSRSSGTGCCDVCSLCMSKCCLLYSAGLTSAGKTIRCCACVQWYKAPAMLRCWLHRVQKSDYQEHKHRLPNTARLCSHNLHESLTSRGNQLADGLVQVVRLASPGSLQPDRVCTSIITPKNVCCRGHTRRCALPAGPRSTRIGALDPGQALGQATTQQQKNSDIDLDDSTTYLRKNIRRTALSRVCVGWGTAQWPSG
jgi:hypothetical protein